MSTFSKYLVGYGASALGGAGFVAGLAFISDGHVARGGFDCALSLVFFVWGLAKVSKTDEGQ